MTNFLMKNLFSHMQKRFLSASVSLSSASTSLSSSFTVQYLMNSCGLPLESAVSVSHKLQLDEQNHQKYQSVVEFLKSHNFSNDQLAKLVEKRPAVLQCRVRCNLKPKFEFFINNGFVREHLTELIVSNPVILKRALDSHIKPSFEFLRNALSTQEKIILALKRSSWLLTFDLKGTMQPNLDFLIKEGVPAHSIEKLLILQPRAMMQRHDRLVYAVDAVKQLGLPPASRMFIHAVRVMISMNESTWNKKFELLKSMGWTEDEILMAFKRDPLCLACSEEKLKNVTDFYLNAMKVELQTIIAYPKFLMYSVDKRLRPRYNVLKVLDSKRLIDWNNKMVWLLTINEKNFLNNYVNRYADKVPGLLEMYPGASKAKELTA